MENLITFLYRAVESPAFLLCVLCFSVSVKLRYVTSFAPHIWKHKHTVMPLLFLLLSIGSALMCDVSWFVKLAQSMFIPQMPYYIVVFFIRIAWAFLIIQYFTLGLFLQQLSKPHTPFKLIQRIGFAVTALLSTFFVLLAFIQPFTLATELERDIAREAMTSFEFMAMRYIVPPIIGTFALLGLYAAFKSLSNRSLPTILRKQIKLFTCFFIVPYLMIEGILATCFTTINELHFTVSVSTLLLAGALYYCLQNVIKLRFSNQHARVQGQQSPYVINQFKTVIEQLNNATSTQELIHITQAFFKEAFAIPPYAIKLSIKNQYPTADHAQRIAQNELIDSFFAAHGIYAEEQNSFFQEIIVRDEIAFNNFYTQTDINNQLLQFLHAISADIVLPIYSNKRLVASISISHYDRQECISHSEQDAMIAFASYLGNIINLLHQKDRDALLYREKKLKDILYNTHQEINQYKETIHSFLRNSKHKALGIIFYKNGYFTRANDDAQKLIPIDPNEQIGHPLSIALQKVAYHVETFKTAHNQQVKDHGHTLLISGVPHLTQSHIILTISHPDVSDVIMKQMHLLQDPNDWDYLLYLSSTKIGQRINSFIPSVGEIVLNSKIQLLKAALSKKATLINCADADLLPTVRLLHSVSLQEHLHTLSLMAPTRPSDMAVKLFGAAHSDLYELPLLQQFKDGTLFIKNIHYLDLTTQSYLAEYIARGQYRMFETEQYMPGSTRIICSTNQMISELVHDGKFNPQLYGLLKKQTVVLPSPYSLSTAEIDELITGFSEALIQSSAAKNLLVLTAKERLKILESLPASMQELKERIEQLTFNKSDQTGITTEFSERGFDDPILIHAARLGKQALKDEHIMGLLWEKFKSQNKIALFLGVNRSSVNRRFKAFQINENSQGVA